MSITIVAADAEHFTDVTTMLGPKNPESTVCWCLAYRLDGRTNRELVGPARCDYMRELCAAPRSPGVLAYDGDDVVGWAAVAPRSETTFARSTKIPNVDDTPVWSIWCIKVRPGHRGKGISHALLSGAVDWARRQDAVAIEGYPVDNAGARVNQTLAYVGTRKLFEQAGFTKAAYTTSVSDGFPRVVMRLDLR
jgi:GNAT superfamily N-acetyltransferase